MRANQAVKRFTICQYCGRTFKEKRDIQNVFCSKSCAGKARKWFTFQEENKDENEEHKKALLAEYKERLKDLESLMYRIEHEKVCRVCGQEFLADSKSAVYCSRECARKGDNARRDKRIRRNGKADLSINLTRLYMRDGGVCALCGKHIDFDCDPQSNEYPSIDHIIPIARGGLHVWDNVQLACRGCNTAKGAN